MALAVLGASLAIAARSRAEGLIGASYQLNWDQTVDRTDLATTSTWTFKETLDVKYRGFMSPVIKNEITMKVEQQVKSEGEPRNMIRVNPAIILGYQGSYWSAGGKRTVDDSNEPNKNAKIADSYFVELLYRPPRATLPDLKAKYTLDTDQSSGTSDSLKHSLAVSSIDRPQNWLELKGDYVRNWTRDKLTPDADTRDEKITGAIGIRHIVSPNIRVNSDFKVEDSTGATLLSAGGTTNDKHDRSYDWKNSLTFLPFRGTTVDGAYDWGKKQNFVTSEVDYQQNFKVMVGQSITSYLDVKGDYTRTVNEVRQVVDENRKIEETFTVDVKPNLSRLFAFTLKWQKKDTTEIHFHDPAKDTTSGTVALSGAWTAKLTPFWLASASYDKTDTITREVTTLTETKYGLRSTFEFNPINLTLDPTYDITLRDDRGVTPPLASEIRDFKLRIGWKFLTTATLTGKMDHTYGRKEDSAAQNIQRTDTSNLNILWAKPVPNWNVGIDATRSATDTSGDDLPADITSSVALKADFHYEWLTLNTSYKYDKHILTDDSETFDFKWGWATPRWDFSMTYSFTKTFSIALKEGYTFGIAFKYNL